MSPSRFGQCREVDSDQRAVQDINVYASPNSGLGNLGNDILLGSFTSLFRQPTGQAVTPQVLDLTDALTQFVRLEIIRNYGHSQQTGFGEIAFHIDDSPTAVPMTTPEPSSVVFLVAGLGGLAVMHRRKRRAGK